MRARRVQQLYTQWTLGKLDAHTLIERLNLIPEILGIGPRVRIRRDASGTSQPRFPIICS